MSAWDWDDDKAQANLAKHGIAFATAVLVFEDPLALTEPDPHPDQDRWRTIGGAGVSVLFVVHTVLEPDGSARIISARKATRAERRRYEGLRFTRDHS